MRIRTVCARCESKNIERRENGKCFCNNCGKEQNTKSTVVQSPHERTRAAVFATGNKWAIENFNATH